MADSWLRKEVIGDQTLYLGNCLDILPALGRKGHMVFDPPYEDSLHKARNSLRGPVRADKGPDLKGLNFSGINAIRHDVVQLGEKCCDGWYIAFCTAEGAGRWADKINASSMKYKRACFWEKPDCTPQLNGQGPAMGGELFVTAWNGNGHAKWNAGGKRGVYKHNVNPSDRHGGHPTEKPWRLMVEILQDFTNPEDTIFDGFMGSGTTLVSCVKTGRKGIGIELDPDYFDIACKRVEEAYRQPDMFVAPLLEKETQEVMNL